MTAPKNVSSRTPSSWEPQDDVLLRHLKEVKHLGWKEIAQYFMNRTPNACQFRWRRLKSGSLKTAKSTDDEDELPELSTELAALQGFTNGNPGAAAGAGNGAGPGAGPGTVPGSGNAQGHSMLSVDPAHAADSTSAKKKSSSVGPMPMPVPMPIPTSKVTNGAVLSSPHGNSFGLLPGNRASVTLGSSVSSSVNGLVHSGSLSKSPFSNASPATTHGKFIKPRSSSHSHDGPLAGGPHFNDQEENFGFIPKVFIKSRRGSAVVMNNSGINNSIGNLAATGIAATPQSTTLNLSTSNLASTKSRKNSFSSRSRRSSFNVTSDRHFIPLTSNASSRRSSVVALPSASTPQSKPRRDSFTTSQSTSRSNSISQFRRGSIQAGYIDMPSAKQNFASPPPPPIPQQQHQKQHQQHQQPHIHGQSSAIHGPINNPHAKPWSDDEDKLLVEKRQLYHLSIDELSILLPHRSEQEIQWRMESLQISSIDTMNSVPIANEIANSNAVSSPLADDVNSSSYSPDTAVEEQDDIVDDDVDVDIEIVGRMEDSVAPTQLRDNSPTFSPTSSTGSSARERSPVFSPDTHSLRDQSPTISDGNGSSLYSNRAPSHSVPKQIRQVSTSTTQHHQHHNHHPISNHHANPHHQQHQISELTPNPSQSPQLTHQQLPQPSSQPLPSLNTIFKHII